jgi:hypothetical protein
MSTTTGARLALERAEATVMNQELRAELERLGKDVGQVLATKGRWQALWIEPRHHPAAEH